LLGYEHEFGVISVNNKIVKVENSPMGIDSLGLGKPLEKPFEKLFPLYSVADVALVTPLRDGMNLVAKEFVASKKK